MQISSPFRYPGSKSKLLSVILPLIPESDKYVDLFVGGGSVAIALAIRSPSANIVVNDLDLRLFRFRNYIATSADVKYLVDQIDAFVPSVESFRQQQSSEPTPFTALALNRCAFSGILHGNPIGGKAQTSQWKVDCRYNKSALKAKIVALHRLLHGRLEAWNLPAEEAIVKTEAFIYADPPYFEKGKMLYKTIVDHVGLAKALRNRPNWLLSYDDHATIRQLYAGCKVETIAARYSIQGEKSAWSDKTELLITP